MLAIPVSSKMSWRNPPAATIVLILLNVFIFLIFQNSEEEELKSASAYYFESGLAGLELPRYIDYLKQKSGLPQPELDFSSGPDQRSIGFFLTMLSDDDFMHLLLTEQVITHLDSEYRNWQSLREEFSAKMEQVVSWRFGFRPAAPRLTTLLSHMFLHAGIGHLMGNMLFLWLIGCMIEYGSGRIQFISLYLLGGLAAAGLFWAFNRYSQIPGLGASGAISGIMGAFCVFYGLKKVRIFFTLGFYFNYIKFPALLMLPIWVGHEIFQMLTLEDSNVAYAAHIGGLVGGAGLTYILKKIPGAVDRDVFKEDEEGEKTILEQALRHMRNLEFDSARTILHQILERAPDSIEIMRHLYALEMQTPESAAFHKIAGRLLRQLCKQETTYEDAWETYRDYVGRAAPPRLTVAMYVRISTVLSSLGEVKEANKLLAFLMRKAPHAPGVPTAILKLAHAFQKMNMQEDQKFCLQLITERFPASAEAQIARRAL